MPPAAPVTNAFFPVKSKIDKSDIRIYPGSGTHIPDSLAKSIAGTGFAQRCSEAEMEKREPAVSSKHILNLKQVAYKLQTI